MVHLETKPSDAIGFDARESRFKCGCVVVAHDDRGGSVEIWGPTEEDARQRAEFLLLFNV